MRKLITKLLRLPAVAVQRMVGMRRSKALTRRAEKHLWTFLVYRREWMHAVGWNNGGSAIPGWVMMLEREHPEIEQLRLKGEAHRRLAERLRRKAHPNGLHERTAAIAPPAKAD